MVLKTSRKDFPQLKIYKVRNIWRLAGGAEMCYNQNPCLDLGRETHNGKNKHNSEALLRVGRV